MKNSTTGPEHYVKATEFAKLANEQEDIENQANLIGLGMLHAKLAEVAVLAHSAIAAESGSRAASLAIEWNRVAGLTFTEAEQIRRRG